MPIFRLTQTRIPPEYRCSYATELGNVQAKAARTLAFASFIIFPLFGFTGIDYLFAESSFMLFFAMRSGLGLVYLLLFVLLGRSSFRKFSELASFGILILAGWSIDIMIRRLGYESPYYAGLNIIYLGMVFIPSSAGKTLLACMAIYAFYVVPILLFDMHRFDIRAFVSNNQFQLCTIIVAAIANHIKFNIIRDQIISRLTITKQARELEEIDQYKREFIANITHELKTPLAIVMGNADLILERTSDPELQASIDLIRKAAFQLANHVDRIIAVSSVDDPQARPDLGNYDYCGVVQNVTSLYEPQAREEGITFAVNVARGPLVVNIDIVRMEEVLNNLIQNAFKFTPSHGIITVTVSTDGIKVYTEVSDSGVGIPEEKMGRLFERLYQADEVLSKRHAGMGLGLHICKKNVELHGGEIDVHSKQGKGTSFKFSLPLYVDQTVAVKNRPYEGDDRRAMPRRSGEDRRSIMDRRMEERRKKFEYQQRMGLDELSRMTYADNIRDYENSTPSLPSILILEDNPGMMKVIVEALREDYNLLLAFDAFEAIRVLETDADRIELILSDIMMPGLSGFDFCKRIMAHEEYKRIPLIFITALMSQDDQQRGYEVGATDYIVKPYNIKILKEKVDHWISRRQYERLLKSMSGSLEERVVQLSRVKDVILHEIRNPLQIISGAGYFVDRLRLIALDHADEKEKKLWKNVTMLQQGIDALTSVLEATQQLDMAELSSRRPELLTDIIQEAIAETRHLLGQTSLDTDIVLSDDTLINCDKRMLVQVLVNLIRNGVEAIREREQEGGGLIVIHGEHVDDKRVRLKITDNGIGMEPEVVDRLFGFKFTTKKDGTGVGLHLSKMIVKLHDGQIAVESQKDVGTTFTVILPVFAPRPATEPVFAS